MFLTWIKKVWHFQIKSATPGKIKIMLKFFLEFLHTIGEGILYGFLSSCNCSPNLVQMNMWTDRQMDKKSHGGALLLKHKNIQKVCKSFNWKRLYISFNWFWTKGETSRRPRLSGELGSPMVAWLKHALLLQEIFTILYIFRRQILEIFFYHLPIIDISPSYLN